MPRKTPETRNLTAKSRRASFGHVGIRGGKVPRPKSSKTRLVLLCVRGTFRKLLALDVVELISYSPCLMDSNGKLSLNDNAEAAKAAAKKKPAPAPKRKPTTSRHESLSKCHTAPQKFGMSIGRAPKRAARPSQALDKLVGYCSPTLTQNGTSFKIQNLNLTQTLSQTMDRH